DEATGSKHWPHPSIARESVLDISSDGKVLLTASRTNGGGLLLRESASGTPIDTISETDLFADGGLCHDGQSILTVPDPRHTVWHWTRTSAVGKPPRLRKSPLKNQSSVQAIAISQDSKAALTGHLDKTARLWDLSSCTCTRTFDHPAVV